MPAVLNGANEAAVGKFLEGKIKYLDIIKNVERIVNKHKVIHSPLLQDILASEAWAKEEVSVAC